MQIPSVIKNGVMLTFVKVDESYEKIRHIAKPNLNGWAQVYY